VVEMIKAMELANVDTLSNEYHQDTMEELNEVVVDKILRIKTARPRMRSCENKKKTKEDNCGPILMERQRRRHDNVPVLQRAMELKKKRNLGL
jgi:hypothetical protein